MDNPLAANPIANGTSNGSKAELPPVEEFDSAAVFKQLEKREKREIGNQYAARPPRCTSEAAWAKPVGGGTAWLG